MDELAQVQTESGQIWVLAASVPRVLDLELAQKGREEKEAKHSGKSGEHGRPTSSSSVAPAAVPVQHGLSGTFKSAGMNLLRVAKKQKVMKVESSS